MGTKFTPSDKEDTLEYSDKSLGHMRSIVLLTRMLWGTVGCVVGSVITFILLNI